MKSAIHLTSVYALMFLAISFATFSSLKSCSQSLEQDPERVIAYQVQFQNANEQAVFVRKLGE
ncbi:hypothetical protein [Acinetobacter sp. NIPH 298]|uniref:hypothetical protein n=1 Tax=Acinetobacter sp. NIPH 298 TaxID=1217692 RepID=UPI0002CFE8D9|nr:hypothetical protein [Acinetobacter sp. NIPH 298]ENW95945.1 hypothetical protein F903_01713 [Acinetobacter sp. NIPH 298]